MKRWMRVLRMGLLLCGAAATLPSLGRAVEPRESAAAESPDYYVQTWQQDEGLPRNTLTAITQTPDGYLWLASAFGLVRFDGVRFTSLEENAPPALARSLIRDLMTDHAGRLWIGTGQGGILVYEQGTFHRLDGRSGLPHLTVYSMCEDKAGVVWVATGDGSISRIRNGRTVERIGFLNGTSAGPAIQLVRDQKGEIWFTRAEKYGQLREGVATNVVSTESALVHLCPSADGSLWLLAGKQLRKLGAGTNATPALSLPFGNYEVWHLFEDRRGHLWIGTRSRGLFVLQSDKLQAVFPNENPIRGIYEDTEGSLWVASEGSGLSKVRPRIFNLPGAAEGLPRGRAQSVCEDPSGDLWIAPRVGALVRCRPDRTFGVESSTVNLGLTTVLPRAQGGLYLGTVNRGVLRLEGGEVENLLSRAPFRNNQVRVLYSDSKDTLWVGLLPSGLASYTPKQVRGPAYYAKLGLPPGAIQAVVEDRAGAVWCGTANGDLYRLADNRFTGYKQKEGLPGAAISALHVDAQDTLWVGTQGSGLGCLRKGKFTFASVREGLYDNVISQIAEDDCGYFWFGSARGIFRVLKRDLEQFMAGQRSGFESVAYGKSDGLPNVECTGGYQPSVWKTRAGHLWFATSKGVVHFDPAALSLTSPPPPLVIEALTVNGESRPASAGLKLNWNHQKIEVQYTALSFASPEKVHFRRQLVGFDPDWVEAGTARSALYPRLSPGRYEFRVTACNADGVWNGTPCSLAWVVLPAWWQRLWVQVGLGAGLAAAVAGLARYLSLVKMRRRLGRLEQAHALEKERARIARDIHDDVGARLTQMAYLSDLAAAEEAEGRGVGPRLKQITSGAQQTVRALDEIVWAVNPRKDSLPHLVEYISQYANHFFRGTNTRCRQDLPESLPEWGLSSEFRHHLFLAAKEALNNIQKHSNATEVWLRVTVQPPRLELIIEDNGVGFTPSESTASRDGLKNMRSRLALLGGECHISSQPNTGTRLVLTVRLPKIDAPSKKEP